jgi:CBS domain-containing protein
MNILFFLKPKNELSYIYNDFTLRQALEKMEFYRFSAIPVLSRDGQYIKTITEGDILWSLKNWNEISFVNTEEIYINEIKNHRVYKSIGIDRTIDDLIDLISDQNFVPVVDDRNMFIGIITRKSVIEYLYSKTKKEHV